LDEVWIHHYHDLVSNSDLCARHLSVLPTPQFIGRFAAGEERSGGGKITFNHCLRMMDRDRACRWYRVGLLCTSIIVLCCLGTNSTLQMVTSECRHRWLRLRTTNPPPDAVRGVQRSTSRERELNVGQDLDLRFVSEVVQATGSAIAAGQTYIPAPAHF